MLKIRQTKHLLERLGATAAEAEQIIAHPEEFYEELLLVDPQKPGKERRVVNVLGLMRRLQQRLYRSVLLPKLNPSQFSHGSVPGRSVKTNAFLHLGATFAFKMDINDFFPSIHYTRVYGLFSGGFQCSPDVARICTKICTYKHHLALGLITSPVLADQMLSRVDRRVAGLCSKNKLNYSRYVDDITVSGRFDLSTSGFPSQIEAILEQDGFRANPLKNKFGRLDEGFTVTNLRLDGKLDVTKEYADEVFRQLADAVSLARGGEFDGPYYTRAQILGRVRYICWINPGRRYELIKRYNSIQWDLVRANAISRRLEASRKTLSRIP